MSKTFNVSGIVSLFGKSVDDFERMRARATRPYKPFEKGAIESGVNEQPLTSSLRWPQASGNPGGLSIYFAVPGTEPPSGFPRRYASRNDEVEGEHRFSSIFICTRLKDK